MHFSKVKYTKEFQYHGISEWISTEVDLEPGEDAKVALNNAKNIVHEFYAESIQQESLPIIQEKRITPGMQLVIDKINKATTTEQLEKERTRADMNPVLKEVFNEKLKELKL